MRDVSSCDLLQYTLTEKCNLFVKYNLTELDEGTTFILLFSVYSSNLITVLWIFDLVCLLMLATKKVQILRHVRVTY